MINKSHLCRIIVLFIVNLNICSITKCRRLIIGYLALSGASGLRSIRCQTLNRCLSEDEWKAIKRLKEDEHVACRTELCETMKVCCEHCGKYFNEFMSFCFLDLYPTSLFLLLLIRMHSPPFARCFMIRTNKKMKTIQKYFSQSAINLMIFVTRFNVCRDNGLYGSLLFRRRARLCILLLIQFKLIPNGKWKRHTDAADIPSHCYHEFTRLS